MLLVSLYRWSHLLRCSDTTRIGPGRQTALITLPAILADDAIHKQCAAAPQERRGGRRLTASKVAFTSGPLTTSIRALSRLDGRADPVGPTTVSRRPEQIQSSGAIRSDRVAIAASDMLRRWQAAANRSRPKVYGKRWEGHPAPPPAPIAKHCPMKGLTPSDEKAPLQDR